MKFQIFVDMDGVLCNFEKRCKDLWPKLNIDNDEQRIELYEKIRGKGAEFWSEIEWTKFGKVVWEMVEPFQPIILSAPLASDPYGSTTGKKLWLQKHISMMNHLIQTKSKNGWDGVSSIVLCANKHHFVGTDKNTIYLLIDDSPSKCENFTLEGGHSILWTDELTSIARLQKVVTELHRLKGTK